MKSIAERLKIANRRGQGALWVLLCTVMFVATALGSPITTGEFGCQTALGCSVGGAWR